MIDLNPLAIGVSAIAGFIISSVYYIPFGAALKKLGSKTVGVTKPPPWQLLVELARKLVVSTTLAGFVSLLGITSIGGAVALALAVWVGFALVLYSGSVIWEKVPFKLAAIHAGDWIAGTLVITIIVTLWR